MAIDLLNIQPQKISKDMASYTSLIYGPPKIGKTSFVHDLYGEDALFVATEKGYKALAGAMVQDCGNWSDFMKIIGQLRKAEVKEKFKVVVIDTVDLLHTYAEKFILNKHNAQAINEIPWGQGYAELTKTLQESFDMIEKQGFTLCFISHSTTKTEKIPQPDNKEDIEVEKYIPTVPKRGLAVITKMVDNILFASTTQDEEGKQERVIHTRETMQWQAGARFSNVKPTFPLSAAEYEKAMVEAIDTYDEADLKEEKESNYVQQEQLDYEALMEEAKELATQFHSESRMNEVVEIVENVFGPGEKLTNAKESQVEQLSVALERMKEQYQEQTA